MGLRAVLTTLREVEAEAVQMGTQRKLLETLTTETVTLKKHLLNEKRRTASMYLSLSDAVAAKQEAEATVVNLRQHVRSLITSNRKHEKNKINDQMAIQKLSTLLSDAKKKAAAAAASNGKMKKHAHRPPLPAPACAAAAEAAFAASSSSSSSAAEDDTSRKRERDGDTGDGSSSARKKPRPPFNFDAAAAMPAAAAAAAAAAARHGLSTPASSSSSSAVGDDDAAGTSVNDGKYVGRAVKKIFGRRSFEGKIDRFDPPYYHVVYNDGDEEDMELAEVEKYLVKPKAGRTVSRGAS
jgi:hypothetical protein